MNENVEPTEIAREIIREELDLTPFWVSRYVSTNTYPTCWTVKTHIDEDNLERVPAIRERVEATIPGGSVRVVPGEDRNRVPYTALVVRIPR